MKAEISEKDIREMWYGRKEKKMLVEKVTFMH